MNYKKYITLLSSALLLCILSCGCSNTDNKNTTDNTDTISVSVKDTTQTVENGNIKITLENTYSIEKDTEYYKPSILIQKAPEQYISVETLKDGASGVEKNSDGTYPFEKMKEDFIKDSGKYSKSPVSELEFGNKKMVKISTYVNGVESDIYRYVSNSNEVFEIVVAGKEFKESAEAEEIVSKIELK